MDQSLLSKTTIVINAPVATVWDALTNPSQIKQYLFGTEVISNWQTGSSIIYKGVWKGKVYEDKGTIIAIVPEKLLDTTYWSGMSGQADIPGNYKHVVYALEKADNKTTLTITQDGNRTAEEKAQSEKNWNMVLMALKKLLEQ